jgi:hypothetical protein
VHARIDNFKAKKKKVISVSLIVSSLDGTKSAKMTSPGVEQ